MKRERLSISIRTILDQWLRKRAKANGRSLSSEIEYILEEFFKEWGGVKK
jgi:hypothetical protein